MEWRKQLAKVVQLASTSPSPEARFCIRPPSGLDWPAELPSGGALPRFYALCDGGMLPDCLGWAEFFPLDELVARTREFGDRLSATLEAQERTSPFVAGRHVLFGGDGHGRLYRLWDAETDGLVGYLPADDHDWVEAPDAPSMDDFLDELFSTRPYRRVRGSAMSEWWMEILGSGRQAPP